MGNDERELSRASGAAADAAVPPEGDGTRAALDAVLDRDLPAYGEGLRRLGD